ncbi:GlcNAc-PI de-N-acetylase [Photorhabdus luminescens]|nr:GlcNAc-PI de-N-acetylase [Photorhabdus luminescens]
MSVEKNILIVAPHADDETLGCGGAILRYREEGYNVHWVIITSMSIASGFTPQQIANREEEISLVATTYNFKTVKILGFPPAALETIPRGEIIKRLAEVISSIRPEQIWTAYRNDAHSDHEIVYDCVMSCSKIFRYPYVKRILAYETLSETDFGMKPEDGGFRPNVFIDISAYLERKLTIMGVFKSEIGEFPFPRSEKALRALATLRGVQSGCEGAEGFMLIKEVM